MAQEKTPVTRERFTIRERYVLLDQLYASSIMLRSNLVFNSPHLDPYVEILAVATVLVASGDDLTSPEKKHLRKMAALEARRLPPLTKTAGDAKFWEELKAHVGQGWEKAQSFSEDLNDVPKSWQKARDDLFLLNRALREKAR